MSEMTHIERERLSMLEGTIQRGLRTFFEVGAALVQIRDQRLYRERHTTFEAYCQERWGMTRRHADRLIQGSEVVREIGAHRAEGDEALDARDETNWSEGLPQNEAQARELARAPQGERAKAWQEAQARHGTDSPPARVVREVVEERAGEDVGSEGAGGDAPGRDLDRDSYSTPEYILELVREVMGGIDLDPATNPAAQELVQAEVFYTLEDDGLEQPWFGRVWLNPPYSQPACRLFTEKVVAFYQNDEIEQAIVLVNTASGAKWWQHIARHCWALAFPDHRIQFWHPQGESADRNRYDQTLFYFGDQVEAFCEVMRSADMLAIPMGEAQDPVLTGSGKLARLTRQLEKAREVADRWRGEALHWRDQAQESPGEESS